MGFLIYLVVAILALLGAPLFAVMGGSSEIAWFLSPDPTQHVFRRIAANILEEKFAGSPILITIPLFTFVGYVMAESKAPDRIVRGASAFFGWLPGGLALVCIMASAFFTTLTGGSGVTIIAIGGLLYPALVKQGYPKSYALGLVTVGGSLGLLFAPSLPIIVYAQVAGIDVNSAFKAAALPGFLIVGLLYAHAARIAIKNKVPRESPNLKAMGEALWLLKWELFVPVLILGSLAKHIADLDEVAALTAIYIVIVEVFIHKDLGLRKDMPRVVKASMVLAGAIILILSMANALMNYVITAGIPAKILDTMLGLGLTQTWQFLVVLNVFLIILGMLMEGFSAILVAVPLMLPFAATFHLQPFHLAVMFLLNLELAYCMPPLGLNLFIASFRFDRPLVSLYRVVLPFTGILALGLGIVMYLPKLSTMLIEPDIAKAYAQAEHDKAAPRDAWLLQCVQEDRTHPLPCTDEDRARFGKDGTVDPYAIATPASASATPSASAAPSASASASASPEDDLMQQMMNAGTDAGAPAPSATPSATPSAEPKLDTPDEIMKEMMK